MDRASFLKALAALGLVASPIRGASKEEEKWVEEECKVRLGPIRAGKPDIAETLHYSMPSSLDLESWEKLGVSEEKLLEMAIQSYRIRLQAHARVGMRDHLLEGESLQAYVDAWHYDPDKFTRPRRVSYISYKQLEKFNFTKAQFAYLRSAGVKIV